MFKIERRVCFCDTDASMITYHSKYLDFCEEARVEFILSLGLSQKMITNDYNTIFVLRNCNVNYLKATMAEDLLTVTIEKIDIKGPLVKMIQNIYRGQEKTTECEINLAAIDRDFKPLRRIHNDIVNKMLI